MVENLETTFTVLFNFITSIVTPNQLLRLRSDPPGGAHTLHLERIGITRYSLLTAFN